MRSFKKSMAIMLVLVMVLTAFGFTSAFAYGFSDTSGHWAESVIDKWSNAGVVNGYSDGTFLPDAYISRAELAKVISTAKQYTALADIEFVDVNGDEWYVSDLRKCVAQGIIGGYEDNTFRADDAVTREEAATMFQRAYKINSVGLLNFADNNQISEWAKAPITSLVGAGVINGYSDGTFGPSMPIARAEVVKILDGITEAANTPQSTTGPITPGQPVGNLGGGGGGGGGGNTDPNTATVTFNANGGKFAGNAATKSITVTKGSLIGSKAPVATLDALIFDGWYTSKDAADNLVEAKKWDVYSKPVPGNIVLYAGWLVDGTSIVSFEVNGGAPAVPSQTVNLGGLATVPDTVMTRAHYTFVGWYVNNSTNVAFDFAKTPIKKSITLYARWTVDADYAAVEVTMPTVPVGQMQPGTMIPVPPSVIPGEKETIIINPPSGYMVDQIPVITYVSSQTGETVTIPAANIKDNKDSSYTFTFPSDVTNGSVAVRPHYATALPTAPPATPVPSPSPTLSPDAPTPVPAKEPTIYFSQPVFDEYPSLPANTEVGGIKVSIASTIEASSKTFSATDTNPNNSGYKYAKVCKIGKALTTFKVTGPCKITVDVVSANNTSDRAYTVKSDSATLGTATCIGGAANSGIFNHAGGASTITITPADGLNLYGIFVEYADVPTPAPVTPSPTIDPNIKYQIYLADDIKNGSIAVNNGQIWSDEIKTVTWNAADCVPEGSIEGETEIYGPADILNINGVDNKDGTIRMYTNVKWWTDYDALGKPYVDFRASDGNPSVSPPFSDTNRPGGNVFSVQAPDDGYLTISVYIYNNKAYKLYDNLEQKYIQNFTTGSTPGKYTFTFPCERNAEYFTWADGSKIGLATVSFSNGNLEAKRGDTITVKTKPDTGFKANEVTTNPATSVTKAAENTYTFTMPQSEVTIGATFVDSSAIEYTASAPKPANGTVKLEKGEMALASVDDEAELAAANQTIFTTSENFLMADGKGGKWIVSSDGTIGTTALADQNNIAGNSTEKLKLTNKAAQYALKEKITSGEFELSYDFYDDNTVAAGRSFRTYLDNDIHPFNAATGQATAFGSDYAFFHMTNVSNNVYVTKEVSDVAIGTAAGKQIGSAALATNKWYRVVVKGELGTTDPLTVSYYMHGTDGQYNPAGISATPTLTSTEATFTDSRTASLAQIKFMRTAAGNLYYDNVKLTAANGTPEDGEFKIKAFNGETIKIIATPDQNYQVGAISVKETAGADVPVTGTSFVMPKSDVTVSVTFDHEATPSPEPTLKPTNAPEPTVDPGGETKAWVFTYESVSPLLDPVPAAIPFDITKTIVMDGLSICGASGKAITVDASNKTIGSNSYATRAKFGGAGAISGAGAARYMMFTPDAYGTVTIDFAHASSSGSDRSCIVTQNGISASKSVAPGIADSFTAVVYPGSPVYIYGDNAINPYGIYYTKSTEPNPPSVPPVPTNAPTSAPTTAPTTAPTQNPDVPTPDPTVEPSAKPTEEPAGDFWKAAANIVAGQELSISGLSPMDAMTYKDSVKEIGGVTFPGNCAGANNPAADGTSGASMKFVPTKAGTVTCYYKVGAGKIFKILDAAGSEIIAVTNTGTASAYEATSADVVAGETYYMFVAGSKAEFFGIKFEGEK